MALNEHCRRLSDRSLGLSAINACLLRAFKPVFELILPEFSTAFGSDLSRLVHQRAARKPISDARTATYVILSTGSGPAGRWFKSIRPDHSSFFARRKIKSNGLL